MANKIQIRRDTAANWTSANPTLSQGEQGYETDTGKLKIGDGSTAWTSLGYSFESSAGGATGTDYDDDVKVRFGTGNDLEIYHDGTTNHSYIKETNASGHLNIQGQEINFKNPSGTTLLNINGAQVELRQSGNKKLETTTTGIQTTGTVNVNGAYTLPTSDGTNGQVLTTDGSGAVTFADAGGSFELIDENRTGTYAYTAPSATGDNAIAIGSGATASGSNHATALGLNATASNSSAMALMGTASGSQSTSMGHLSSASAGQSMALGLQSSAGAASSVALGRYATTATNDYAMAFGKSYASGGHSLAAVIENNTSTYGSTQVSAIAMGSLAKASQSYSVALGRAAQATGGWSYALGQSAAASGTPSHVLGHNASASAANSISIGSSITNSTANQIVLGGTAQTVKISDTYTLPRVDGTNGQVLTTDGSGAVSFADAGGGGADLYAANPSTATNPTATGGNAIAIGDAAQAGNFDEALAIGTSSLANNIQTQSVGYDTTASGNRSSAFGRGATASGDYSTSIGYGPTASGSSSIALGRSATAVGSYSTALGNSYASGTDSFAAAIANNTSSYGATGANSIAIGYQAKSQGSTNGSVAIGHNAQATSRETVAIGSSAYATGSAAVALGGYFGTSVQARATGTTSFAVAGSNGLANKDSVAAGLSSIAMAGGYAQHNQSVAIGTFAHANVRGKVAWSSYPLTNADGATQAGNYVLSNSTTDATATKLVTDYDWTSAGSINQIVLPNNSVYGFTGTVIAREDSSSTDDFAVWEIKGGAVRGASASTTALGSYNINKISESTGAANWSIALSADTTNGAVAITVTGEAAHNIRWVATVNTTEVIY